MTSTECLFAKNGRADTGTVRLFMGASWTSTNDAIEESAGDAISLGEEECTPGTAYSLRGLRIAGSGRDGIRVYCPLTLALSGATVLGSGGSGLHFVGNGAGNVSGSAAEPNVFQRTGSTANALAGICNEGTGAVGARNVRWGRCPAARHPDNACAGAIDIGTNGQPGAVDAEPCVQ